jgi:hypothetical protein
MGGWLLSPGAETGSAVLKVLRMKVRVSEKGVKSGCSGRGRRRIGSLGVVGRGDPWWAGLEASFVG